MFAGALGVIYVDSIGQELFFTDDKDSSDEDSNKQDKSDEARVELRSIFGHFKSVTGLKLHNTGSDKGYNLLLSASEDFSVRVWALCASDLADSI